MSNGDGSAISLPVLSAELLADVMDGPKRTTSLYARRTPLAEPAAQIAALDAVALDLGPSGTGRFHRDLVASGWEQGLTPAPLEIFQPTVLSSSVFFVCSNSVVPITRSGVRYQKLTVSGWSLRSVGKSTLMLPPSPKRTPRCPAG